MVGNTTCIPLFLRFLSPNHHFHWLFFYPSTGTNSISGFPQLAMGLSLLNGQGVIGVLAQDGHHRSPSHMEYIKLSTKTEKAALTLGKSGKEDLINRENQDAPRSLKMFILSSASPKKSKDDTPSSNGRIRNNRRRTRRHKKKSTSRSRLHFQKSKKHRKMKSIPFVLSVKEPKRTFEHLFVG